MLSPNFKFSTIVELISYMTIYYLLFYYNFYIFLNLFYMSNGILQEPQEGGYKDEKILKIKNKLQGESRTEAGKNMGW